MVSFQSISEFALWNQNLKLCSFARLTGFCDQDSGISQELTDQEQPRACSFTIAEFKYFFLFVKGNSLAIILIDQDQGFSSFLCTKTNFCQSVYPRVLSNLPEG